MMTVSLIVSVVTATGMVVGNWLQYEVENRGHGIHAGRFVFWLCSAFFMFAIYTFLYCCCLYGDGMMAEPGKVSVEWYRASTWTECFFGDNGCLGDLKHWLGGTRNDSVQTTVWRRYNAAVVNPTGSTAPLIHEGDDVVIYPDDDNSVVYTQANGVVYTDSAVFSK